VINRLGFNNKGLENYCANLTKIKDHPLRQKSLVGANIGRNKDSSDAIADYIAGVKAVSPLADYVVINISSPNTPGLRGLQNRDELAQLLSAVQTLRREQAIKKPLFVKIAPDLDFEACEAIADVAMSSAIDGLIISNTTVTRPDFLSEKMKNEAGGLSGPPVFALSNAIIKLMYRLTKAQLPIIGVGGIANAKDAYTKIRLGASLVQLYTALIYQGPSMIQKMQTELNVLLRRDGFSSIQEAIGVDVRNM
jgi:dihydroorotate dehydrogenase